jgi:hypothetical protein
VDRFEHREAFAVAAEEVVLEECRESVEGGIRDRGGGGAVKPPAKTERRASSFCSGSGRRR